MAFPALHTVVLFPQPLLATPHTQTLVTSSQRTLPVVRGHESSEKAARLEEPMGDPWLSLLGVAQLWPWPVVMLCLSLRCRNHCCELISGAVCLTLSSLNCQWEITQEGHLVTAAPASLAPAPDETLCRGQGPGRAASLSAEDGQRGRLRGADGGPSQRWRMELCFPLQAISREKGAGSWPVRGERDRPAFTPSLLVSCSRRELRLRNYVPEDEDLKRRRVPQAKPVAGK